MAVYFDSTDPAGLLAAFKKGIDERHIVTWAYDKDGDFYHTPDQWRSSGFLRPVTQTGKLAFRFIGGLRVKTTWEVYAVLHGRFIEAMIAHCHDRFSLAHATPKPVTGDNVTSSVA